MTYLEASLLYPVREYKTSEGDTYMNVLYNVYNSADSDYAKCIFALNSRYDWDYMSAGTRIKYLDVKVIELVNEI